VKIRGRGPAPLDPDRVYEFDVDADAIRIPSYQINEFDDFGRASYPEQEKLVGEIIASAGVQPVEPVYPGAWGFATRDDLELVALELAREIEPELRRLQAEGRWLFHWSGRRLELLDPRQARSFDPASGQMVPDGEPAVCATPFADIAVFRALTSSPKVEAVRPQRTGFDVRDGELILEANSAVVAALRGAEGWVYVLDRQWFTRRDEGEWRSPISVAASSAYLVSRRHLSTEISVVDDREKSRLTR
jgi:hypothetical protein